MSQPRWWTLAWPGLCATLTGVGFARFSYTALIPFLVNSGAVSAAQADYLGAANLAGYFLGAWVASALAARFGTAPCIRASFILTTLGLALCVLPGGFWWIAPWRLLTGITGAVLMVLGPSFLLVQASPAERGRAGGVIYAGVGLGAGFGSLLVAPLASIGPAWAWAGLALAAAIATGITWAKWDNPAGLRPRPAKAGAGTRITLPLFLGGLAFTMDGAGFVPHSIFWADFVTRELGQGAAIGNATWLLFGLGAVFGPSLAGALGDRIGLSRALLAVFVVKAVAVALPYGITTLPALSLSVLVVGALTPAIPAVFAGVIAGQVPASDQARLWGFATLGFGLAQAGGGWAFSFSYSAIGRYQPLYLAGGLIEAIGAACALAAMLKMRR
ncbi:MAG: YbfB/YjiJ family MFS transporter [Acidobacteriota bacterium]